MINVLEYFILLLIEGMLVWRSYKYGLNYKGGEHYLQHVHKAIPFDV